MIHKSLKVKIFHGLACDVLDLPTKTSMLQENKKEVMEQNTDHFIISRQDFKCMVEK